MDEMNFNTLQGGLATVCSVLKIIDNSFQHCTVMGAKITCFGFS